MQEFTEKLGRQSLTFCTAPDGVRLAVASVGEGPPLVRAAHWLGHVEHDVESPVWRPWLRELSRHNRYIRYDQRGCGLSDRDVPALSLEAWVGDLEAVVDGLELERFPLIGMSQGGAIALTYAARHPERVSHLILVGAYARGALRRDASDEARLEAETLVNLVRVGWGRENPAFRHVFTNMYIPGGRPEQHEWWSEIQRRAAAPEMAARTIEVFNEIDVSGVAGQVEVPTLVMHARGDARVPYAEGRLLAGLIPGARFVSLDSENHVLLETEPAWEVFLAELRGFIGASDSRHAGLSGKLAALTPSEKAVLELLARGYDNRTIAESLAKSEKTVRNQVSSILDKLDVRSRSEAIVFLRDRDSGASPA